jgi:hypothetical protein
MKGNPGGLGAHLIILYIVAMQVKGTDQVGTINHAPFGTLRSDPMETPPSLGGMSHSLTWGP